MSAQEQPQAEEFQTVAGEVAGVITKSADTWQVQVRDRPDSQYTKNLWTKDSQVVGEMTRMIGQPATFFCRVSHWERGDGQPVRSLWVDGWTAGLSAETQAQGAQQEMQPIGAQVETESQRLMAQAREAEIRERAAAAEALHAAPQQAAQAFVPQDVKELRIMREAADKAAAQVLAAIIQGGGLKEEDLTPERLHNFMDAFAQRRIRFYETGSAFDESDIPF